MEANAYVVLLLSLQLQLALSSLTPPQQKSAMATSGGNCQLSVMDLERSWEQYYSDTSWNKQFTASTKKSLITRVQESATDELKDEQMIKYESESS